MDPLLDAFLDSWDRNNTILINLLTLIPPELLDASALPNGPSIAVMYRHIHFTRLWLVAENTPELAEKLPNEPKTIEHDRDRIVGRLHQSAKAVRDAVQTRLAAGRPMDAQYDHPILMIQHLIWHEGYHHGQIKLALKAAGRPLDDEAEAGPATWDVWMTKTGK